MGVVLLRGSVVPGAGWATSRWVPVGRGMVPGPPVARPPRSARTRVRARAQPGAAAVSVVVRFLWCWTFSDADRRRSMRLWNTVLAGDPSKSVCSQKNKNSTQGAIRIFA
jgi:hypothetical protein